MRPPGRRARSTIATTKISTTTTGSSAATRSCYAKVGDKYAALAVPSRWSEQEAALTGTLDRLAADLAEANPDAVIVIGDDEHELFSSANMPALAIFSGDHATARRFVRPDDTRANQPDYAWMKDVEKMYGMDANHKHAVASKLALELFGHLMDAGFDLSACDTVPDPAHQGFGHAFGFVISRLMGERKIPIVPVLLNAYFPPNQPTPKRCYDFGVALRKAIDEAAPGMRVAIIASGGLSHFVTNEAVDTGILDALKSGDANFLQEHSREAAQQRIVRKPDVDRAGRRTRRSETRWSEYIPVYRTPPGTGIGLAFGRWS